MSNTHDLTHRFCLVPAIRGITLLCIGMMMWIPGCREQESKSTPPTGQAVKAPPLHDAVKRNDLEGLKSVLDEMPDALDKQDDLGRTPLHWATEESQLDAAELLLEKGANPNIKASTGATPLHLASDSELMDMAALLTKHGADLDAVDENGWTPLHFAAVRGQEELADLLLKEGADADVKDDKGWTPLHLAAVQGNRRVAEVLIEHGAKPELRDADEKTAADRALTEGHQELANWLKEAQEEQQQ